MTLVSLDLATPRYTNGATVSSSCFIYAVKMTFSYPSDACIQLGIYLILLKQVPQMSIIDLLIDEIKSS